MKLALYSFWRSSCSWRVRIALALKGLPYEYRAVNLAAGDQWSEAYSGRNPMHQVPTLEVEEDGGVLLLTQSLAILEWLEERHPAPPLLPADPAGRARVRALAENVNSGIQPYQNAAPRTWLSGQRAGLEGEYTLHFLTLGMKSLEAAVKQGAGRFCHGDAVSFADLCLVPQLSGARRFGVDLSPMPTLTRIEAACAELEAFKRSVPEATPDAVR